MFFRYQAAGFMSSCLDRVEWLQERIIVVEINSDKTACKGQKVHFRIGMKHRQSHQNNHVISHTINLYKRACKEIVECRGKRWKEAQLAIKPVYGSEIMRLPRDNL